MELTVPLFGVSRETRRHSDRLMIAAEQMVDFSPLQSTPVRIVEERIGRLCDRRFGVAVNSGTDALMIALKALRIGIGDEVLVTDLTFVASASAIVRVGARPVFVDVDDHGLMDWDSAEAACTSRTRALVLVDLLGAMHDPIAVVAFARRHGLLVVEDAAQAFGASFRSSPAGSIGVLRTSASQTIDWPGTVKS